MLNHQNKRAQDQNKTLLFINWQVGAPAFIITLMMEAENTSETSVNFYETTWRNILEGSHLHLLCSAHNGLWAQIPDTLQWA
jgi:hypothetical protein